MSENQTTTQASGRTTMDAVLNTPAQASSSDELPTYSRHVNEGTMAELRQAQLLQKPAKSADPSNSFDRDIEAAPTTPRVGSPAATTGAANANTLIVNFPHDRRQRPDRQGYNTFLVLVERVIIIIALSFAGFYFALNLASLKLLPIKEPTDAQGQFWLNYASQAPYMIFTITAVALSLCAEFVLVGRQPWNFDIGTVAAMGFMLVILFIVQYLGAKDLWSTMFEDLDIRTYWLQRAGN